MTWTPQIVARARTPCWPWDLREYRPDDPHPIGAQCAKCQIDVALDPRLIAYEPLCLHCSMREGLLPLIEREPSDRRSLHEVAVDHGATPPLASKKKPQRARKGPQPPRKD